MLILALLGFGLGQPQSSKIVGTIPKPVQVASSSLVETSAEAAPDPVVMINPQPEDWYKAWIYNEESGNNPTKWNSSGCLGLGQACPASKLLAVCPNEDYACEDSWFTSYMLGRYQTWQKAYYFHLQAGWW